MIALDEYSGHQDLRGLDCRNIIPYVHERMRVVLLKHWFFLSIALSGLESSNARCSLL
jgi:hypothetical protein